MSKKQNAQYYWSEDTIRHFESTRCSANSDWEVKRKVKREIEDFVENNCFYTDEEDFLGVCADLFGVISGQLNKI